MRMDLSVPSVQFYSFISTVPQVRYITNYIQLILVFASFLLMSPFLIWGAVLERVVRKLCRLLQWLLREW